MLLGWYEKIIDSFSETHLHKSYCYESQGNFVDAFNEANLSLQYFQKSRADANRFESLPIHYSFESIDLASVYTVIGDSAYKIGNYLAATDAYKHSIENISRGRYEYQYLNLGFAYYSLGQYNEAQNAFIKHKNIVNQYKKTSRYTKEHQDAIEHLVNVYRPGVIITPHPDIYLDIVY